ncbi:MAG: hypothetical protein JJ902_23595 [Roseibium sp.]|nr:hypothetical protein [Roseibium sp.]
MLSLDTNIAAFDRSLTRFQRDQMPFAMSLAINATLDDVKRAEERALDRKLDRPTPFTKRGLGVKRSTKRRLSGAVFFKPIQSAYLEKLERGGTRRPKRSAIVVPVNQRLNKYGNMSRGAIKRLLAKPNVFSGEVNGVAGIWQRPGRRGGRLKLLVAYEPKATYRPQLRFGRDAFRTARRRLVPNMRDAMVRAIATAK